MYFMIPENKDPSGFKYRIHPDHQVEMFQFAIERLGKGRAVPALCKEDQSLWKALGLKFRGCHCLLGLDDRLTRRNGSTRLLFPTLVQLS